jgi:murein DD-endopeptidase MepM/ murein hydrolase activator NlpD
MPGTLRCLIVLSVLMPSLSCGAQGTAPSCEVSAGGGKVWIGGDSPASARQQRGDCVPATLQRAVRDRCAINRASLRMVRTSLTSAAESRDEEHDNSGGGIAGMPSPPTPLYRFFPMAGNTDHGDIVNGHFVDLDPTAGTQDYQCRGFVGNGHSGVDCGILTFTHQIVGVPVFAARDGIVVFTQDGWPDMNLFGGVQGNIVAIDHDTGAGIATTEYYHLKNGSVAVSVGQQVKAGQQIARCASSGNSFGPHLHFQTIIDGDVYEPFAGVCRPGESGWSNQAPLDTNDLFLVDFGITRSDLNNLANPWWQPWEIPCNSQFSISDPAIYFYWQVYNFPALCPFSVKFYRPDNSLAWNYTSTWSNPEFFRHQKSWFGFEFPPMTPVPGTWRIEFSLNGLLMIDAPFEVVAGVADPDFNRPPQPITIAFDPPAPNINDVVFCRVHTPSGPAKEDLDWDIVRYRYEWKVNGITVRDITNAAQSDAIPHHTACGDSTLTCTVTPSDGVVAGAPATVSIVVSGPHSPDVNCDGAVNADDLVAVILGWGVCPAPPAGCPADVDDSGVVDADDLVAVILNWG